MIVLCSLLLNVVEESNRNVMAVVEKNNRNVVVVVEKNNRNVVAVEEINGNVVVLGEKKLQKCGGTGGGGDVNLYKSATFYLFLSLHSAPEELT